MQWLEQRARCAAFAFASLALSMGGCAHAPLAPEAPVAARVVRHQGGFTVTSATPVILHSGDPASGFAVRHFVATLARISALRLRVTTGGEVSARGAIVFRLDPGAEV